MINSVYGKTMENLRKRTNVRLVNNDKDFSLSSNQLILLIKSLIKMILFFIKVFFY